MVTAEQVHHLTQFRFRPFLLTSPYLDSYPCLLQDVSDSMAANQKHWQATADGATALVAAARAESAQEIRDLKEQLRDLMFTLDTQARLAAADDGERDELQSGTLIVPSASGAAAKGKSGASVPCAALK